MAVSTYDIALVYFFPHILKSMMLGKTRNVEVLAIFGSMIKVHHVIRIVDPTVYTRRYLLEFLQVLANLVTSISLTYYLFLLLTISAVVCHCRLGTTYFCHNLIVAQPLCSESQNLCLHTLIIQGSAEETGFEPAGL